MIVVFKNPVAPVETNANYYKCINCKIEFRWCDGCMSRTIPDGKYHDRTECLCEKCSVLLLNNQLKIYNHE